MFALIRPIYDKYIAIISLFLNGNRHSVIKCRINGIKWNFLFVSKRLESLKICQHFFHQQKKKKKTVQTAAMIFPTGIVWASLITFWENIKYLLPLRCDFYVRGGADHREVLVKLLFFSRKMKLCHNCWYVATNNTRKMFMKWCKINKNMPKEQIQSRNGDEIWTQKFDFFWLIVN